MFPNLFTGTITVLGSVILMFVLSWKLTLAIIISLPLLGLILNVISGSSRGFYVEVKKITAKVSGKLSQLFLENKLIKSSNAFKNADDDINNQFNLLNAQNKKIALIDSIISPLVLVILMIILAFIFVYGGVLVSSKEITTGAFVAFLIYIFQIISPLTSLGSMLNDWKSAEGSSEELIKLLEEKTEQSGKQKLQNKIDTIAFENVSFSYKDKDDIVLNGITFKVKPNESIAFVGPSGGGKTTIINLLERFYQPNSEKIFFGKTDIKNIDIAAWRKNISLVSQSSSVISGTIRDNLVLGLDNITDKEIWEALQEAYAKDFV
jgi:ATP-binding cassette subfamily B protein AbcA/BmrA